MYGAMSATPAAIAMTSLTRAGTKLGFPEGCSFSKYAAAQAVQAVDIQIAQRRNGPTTFLRKGGSVSRFPSFLFCQMGVDGASQHHEQGQSAQKDSRPHPRRSRAIQSTQASSHSTCTNHDEGSERREDAY